MRQINKSVLSDAAQDRNPNWCITCDQNDRCSDCDFNDWGNTDCSTCDKGKEE